jgi:ferric-dicitrate binding protein FerR (iron transport regulator)
LPKESKAMFLKNKTDWCLLAKFLAGEADEKETQALTDWIDYNSGNRALLKEIKSDWKIMDTMNTKFNVDNAWNKLHNKIIKNDESIVTRDIFIKQNPSLTRYFLTPVRIAASLLLLAILGASLVIFTGRMQKVEVTTAFNEKDKMITLPDGSVVYLNANTTISYAKHFAKKSREVQLKGEAFFEVSPDKSKPFIIYANNARVKVLGTSFNVNARGNNHHVEVYVSTGIVELSEAGNQNNRVLLRPGNIGLISNEEISSARKAENENCIAWKTGDLTFQDTRLTEVTSLLNDIYNVNIVILEPGLDTTRINGSYQNDPLDDILNSICQQNTPLTIAKSADTIYLSR